MTGNQDGIMKFLARGKKLILWHGWDDTTVPAYVTVNFFNAVQNADPQAAMNARAYMAPTVGHCGGGAGADSVDALTVMANWVEMNAPPGSASNPIYAWKRAAGAPADISGASFVRPLCPYPQYASYLGSGDPNLAASFACVPGPSQPPYTR